MVYKGENSKYIKNAEKILHTKESGYYNLACVNIDGFKLLNDQYGTKVGNEILDHVKKSLSECMSQIGGTCMHNALDEFTLIYPHLYEGSELLHQNYIEAVTPDCIPHRLSMHIGRYHVTDRNEDVPLMMYRAKIAADSIRGSYEKNAASYNDSMRQEFIHRQQITLNMEEALRCNQFEVWLQPQHNHATGAIVGAEALVRWNKKGEYLPPSEFIRIFEETGFIYKLDLYVLEEVCKIICRWMDEGKQIFPISVNVSRKDIVHDDFIEKFTSVVDKYKIPQEKIRIEITESAFAFTGAEKIILDRVVKLTEMGYLIEIDDFGNGYSSLNTLKDVPAAAIKLDMHFFDKTGDNERAGNIVESVVRMARWIGMSVIAEGVESKEEADFLLSIGCRYIQGFYYAKPMAVKEFETYMEENAHETGFVMPETVENFENSRFWDPESMDALIFNSYIGGAYIFEYHNRSTEILRINNQYYRQFNGMIPRGTELDDARISGYISDEERKKLFDTVEKAIETHKEQTCRLKIADNKQTEYVDVTMRILARVDNHFLVYGVVVNATEAQMLRLEERNHSRRLETILNNIDCGVVAAIFTDCSNMNIMFCSDGFYKMHGYTKEQFETEVKFLNDLIYKEERYEIEAKISELVKSGESHIYEYRSYKRDGSIMTVSMSGSVVSMEGIEGKVLIGIIRNISNEKGAK